MDDRNLELEACLIETTGEEMMANHLGPNWNKFDDEFGFYPNMAMTVADLVWQHQQAKVEELKKSNRKLEIYMLEIQQNMADANELQKQVDVALQAISEIRFPYDYEDAWEWLEKAEQALKGEG